MMLIPATWFRRIFLILHCLVFLPTSYSQVQDISDFAREDHVHMPINSNLTHSLSQETSGMHQFEGQLVLAGSIEVFWYTWTLDDESEIRMKLEFVPDLNELEKIPLALYPKEPLNLPRRIEVNSPEDALAKIFGANDSSLIVKKKLNRSIQGTARFDVYQTFVECDRRNFQATLSEFKAKSNIKKLAYKHEKRCGD